MLLCVKLKFVSKISVYTTFQILNILSVCSIKWITKLNLKKKTHKITKLFWTILNITIWIGINYYSTCSIILTFRTWFFFVKNIFVILYISFQEHNLYNDWYAFATHFCLTLFSTSNIKEEIKNTNLSFLLSISYFIILYMSINNNHINFNHIWHNN